MKLKELSKDELVKLLTLLCKHNKNQYMFSHTVNGFLLQRWNDLNEKLMQQSDKCDIQTVSGYNKWQTINKQINELQSSKMIEYYCTLDELK